MWKHSRVSLSIEFCLISLKRGHFVFAWRQASSAPDQTNAASKNVGGLLSWSVLLDSPGNALTVGEWVDQAWWSKLVG